MPRFFLREVSIERRTIQATAKLRETVSAVNQLALYPTGWIGCAAVDGGLGRGVRRRLRIRSCCETGGAPCGSISWLRFPTFTAGNDDVATCYRPRSFVEVGIAGLPPCLRLLAGMFVSFPGYPRKNRTAGPPAKRCCRARARNRLPLVANLCQRFNDLRG